MRPETAFARVPDSALVAERPAAPLSRVRRDTAPRAEGSARRSPTSLSELTGPVFGDGRLDETDADLTRQHAGQPLGERIVVTGRVLGSDGKPLRGQLVEIWQANAAGRYRHAVDTHDAPLDPNFTGCGRCVTDDDGTYRFVTVLPGAYPWGNHPNAWRPKHIHFSLFGRAFPERLVTQMYFPGDPLFPFDPIFNSIPDERARERLVSQFELGADGARLGARLPLRHRARRPRGNAARGAAR